MPQEIARYLALGCCAGVFPARTIGRGQMRAGTLSMIAAVGIGFVATGKPAEALAVKMLSAGREACDHPRLTASGAVRACRTNQRVGKKPSDPYLPVPRATHGKVLIHA